MKIKLNKKLILTIELILIISGLVLSCIGAINSLSNDMPGMSEPEMPAAANAPFDEALMPAEGGVPNPGERPEAIKPGMEPPAEPGMPFNDMRKQQGGGDSFSFAIVYTVPIIVYVLMLVYVLVEYRKPHGNLLRITMLVYAFMLAIWSAAQGSNAGCVYVLPCTAVIAAYVSGRLNKIKKNVVWIAIAAVCLIGYGILQTGMLELESYGILQFSYCFGVLLQWITLALAYFSRYEEHVLAGQEEALVE